MPQLSVSDPSVGLTYTSPLAVSACCGVRPCLASVAARDGQDGARKTRAKEERKKEGRRTNEGQKENDEKDKPWKPSHDVAVLVDVVDVVVVGVDVVVDDVAVGREKRNEEKQTPITEDTSISLSLHQSSVIHSLFPLI